MHALIIVDVQNDFCPEGAIPVNEGDHIVPVINRIGDLFDVVVFTQDWHPKNHVSFASTHGKKPGEVIDVDAIPQILWPDHCIQNTWGARLHEGLIVREGDFMLHKGTDPRVDSYSAFFDNRRINKTPLDDYLHDRGIGELFISGLATDYCVKFTALDALELGYSVTVIRDGVRGVDLNLGDVDRAFKEMEHKGARIITSDTVVKMLGQ
ncbi:MAG: bifunctional nicotinamidase/pyrazinamidase [bacterium]